MVSAVSIVCTLASPHCTTAREQAHATGPHVPRGRGTRKVVAISSLTKSTAVGKLKLSGHALRSHQFAGANNQSSGSKKIHQRPGFISCGMNEAQALVMDGTVKPYPPKQAGRVLADEKIKWQVLDVRPLWEFERAYISGSLHVPLFVEDDDTSLLTAVKRQIQFGFGGWWLGQKLTKPNEQFVEQVQLKAPKLNAPLLLACGEGLRSLLAIEKLHDAGYTNLAWIAGGLNNAREGDFASVEGETKLQFATAGGVQGILLKVGQYVADLQQGNNPAA